MFNDLKKCSGLVGVLNSGVVDDVDFLGACEILKGLLEDLMCLEDVIVVDAVVDVMMGYADVKGYDDVFMVLSVVKGCVCLLE
ncbi:hypothetical protein [Marinicella marina]|uniref:hypothetical protein n=1 Tax=Marinicella marina TaxID=2996016 RepID=UPI0024BD53FF|nr:hypothetical protein [Marinicella marina]MDJ1139620.1 hypothetical protein [Marinicella marina]